MVYYRITDRNYNYQINKMKKLHLERRHKSNHNQRYKYSQNKNYSSLIPSFTLTSPINLIPAPVIYATSMLFQSMRPTLNPPNIQQLPPLSKYIRS